MPFLWNFFLNRQTFTWFLIATLLVVGIFSIFAIPKEASPEVSIPQVFVTIALPGATAGDVEKLIINEVEPTILNINDVDKVTSQATQGLATIVVNFYQNADIDLGVQDVRNALEQSQGKLPKDATSPLVAKLNTSNIPVLIVSVSSDLTPESLTNLGDILENELGKVSGVSDVAVSGVRPREISIIAHSEALRQHNISINQLISALSGANASAPAGHITIDGIDYPVQFKGDITSISDIYNVPLVTPSGKIKLSDVATIIDGFEETSSLSHLSVGAGESSYALTLNIFKSKGGSVMTVANDVKTKLAELQDTVLSGSEVVITYDGADEVYKNISELTFSGMQTMLLVILILFIAIGIREALVAAFSIPLSFTIAFIVMWATGNTINFLSLFSLIIAMGILVDSGIVIVEAIHTNRENGLKKKAAAAAAIKQFAWPLIAGTMTTVAVFFPLFFLSGIMGEYMKSIPFTVISVLLASIFVALGFVPLVTMTVIKHDTSQFALRRENLWRKVSLWYKGKMEWLLLNKKVQRGFFAFLTISFIFAMSLPFSGWLKVIVFPVSDYDSFYIELELATASTLKETEKVTDQLEAIISNYDFVESYTTTIGQSSVFSNTGSVSGSNIANINLNLREDRDQTSIELAKQVRADMALVKTNAKISVNEVAGGPPSGAPVVVKVWSEDDIKLANVTSNIEKIIEGITGTRDVTSSLDNDTTQLSVSIDREKANEYGLTASNIAMILQTAVTGVSATTIRIAGEDIDVRVKLDLNQDFVNPEDTTVTDTTAISSIPVQTSRGIIPLGSLVTITAERSATKISHEDGDRLSTVEAYLEGDITALEVTSLIRAQLKESDLPDGVQVTYGGDNEDINQTFTEMLIALLAGLILIFCILILEFNAFRTSGRLLMAIPLSLTGVLVGLWITGQPLSITAFLGIIALSGVIINHGIILLDAISKRHLREPDIKPFDLILETATSRVRPILLTTATTIIGMIPLLSVSAMWAPLAYTIAFGLFYGTLLTLVFIPLMSYRYEMKKFKKRYVP